MADEIIFTVGQHTNELTPLLLYPHVASELISRGYRVRIFKRSDSRSLADIVGQCQEGVRIPFRHLRRYLYDEYWQGNHAGSGVPYQEGQPFIFDWHSYPRNPSIGHSIRDHEIYMKTLEDKISFDTFLDAPSKIAGDVKFEPFASGGGLIELPEYQKSQFRLDIAYKALQALPRVPEEKSDPRALGVVGSSYLMFTDIEATQEQGWLGEEMVGVLSDGIAKMVKERIIYE